MVAVAARYALGAAALLIGLSAWSPPAARTPHSPCWAGSACAVRFVCASTVAHTYTAAAAALVRMRRAYQYVRVPGTPRRL
eukprot:14517966-Alexandrium_andersonii.AAC.1